MFMLLPLLALWPFHHDNLRTDAKVYYHWRLERVSDPFAGTRACRLEDGAVKVSKGLVSFEFGKKVDTAAAAYRIDDGPVLKWRALVPAIAAAGGAVQDDSLANPSGGRVLLPLKLVLEARTVEVQPTPKDKPRLFHLRNLAQAVERADDAECDLKGR